MDVTFLTVFKHLLPRSRLWNITRDTDLRKFFVGLAWLPQVVREYIDAVFWDQFAAYTTHLADQESEYGLPQINATDATRRERLAARKSDTGGASHPYIEAALQALGFPVYVYPAYITDPTYPPVAPVYRNPATYLADDSTPLVYVVEASEAVAEGGEPTALAGDTASPAGYLLVNILESVAPNYTCLASEAIAEAGEPDAEAGQFDIYTWTRQGYDVPADPAEFPFFVYVGGAPFGALASIPSARRRDFDTALLRMFPMRHWIGVMVQYN